MATEPCATLDYETMLWEGHCALAVGLMVERYMKIHPPPPDSRMGGRLDEWSGLMVSLGRGRLTGLGASGLRAV